MATYSNAPNVASAVAVSTSSNATLYTVPANSKFEGQAMLTGVSGPLPSDQTILRIGGLDVAAAVSTGVRETFSITAGPGQVISVQTQQLVTLTGVVLTNGL